MKISVPSFFKNNSPLLPTLSFLREKSGLLFFLRGEGEGVPTIKMFSGVYNTFENRWCVKKMKIYSSVQSDAFLEIPEILETDVHKKFKF